jgi:hypothetical protein
MSALTITLQLLVAAIVIIILYIVTLVVLSIDSLVVGHAVSIKPKQKTVVFDGYGNVSALANKEFNTINQFAQNFVPMPRSINTMGGAQFSYQFWLRVVEADDALFSDLPIMIRGSKDLYKIGMYPYPASTSSTNNGMIKEFPADTYIRCPLIKFGKSWRELIVQFNTSKTPLTTIPITMSPKGGANRRNILSLLPMNWYLMTFVFQDNYNPMETAENGIRFTFYLNDVPYHTMSASTDITLRNNYLKQNDGNLYLLPKPKTVNGEFMNIGDLTYYNYALDTDDVRKAFNSGPPKTVAQINRYERNHQPAHMTAFNKLDIYNY